MGYAGYGGYVWKVTWKQGKITVVPAQTRCDAVPFYEDDFPTGYCETLRNLGCRDYYHISIGEGNIRLVLYKYDVYLMRKGKRLSKKSISNNEMFWEYESDNIYLSAWNLTGTSLKGLFICQKLDDKFVSYLAIGGARFRFW
jgi:hypothetical protein